MTERPEMSKLISRLNENVQLTECIGYIDEKDYEKALECFDSVLQESPANIDALFGKALAMSEMNEWGKAIQILTSILNIEPHNIECLKVKAEVFEVHEKFELALGCYSTLTKVAPSDENVWLDRGKLLEKMGNSEEANASYKEVIKINPNNRFALEILGIETVEVDQIAELDLGEFEENGAKPVQTEVSEDEIEDIAEKLFDTSPTVGETADDQVDALSESHLDETEMVVSPERLEEEVFEEEQPSTPTVTPSEERPAPALTEDDGGLMPGEKTITRGVTVDGSATEDDIPWETGSEREWMTIRDLKRSKQSSAVNIIGVFCIVAVAIYLMYLSAEPIYNNLMVEMDFEVFVPNLIIFLLGFGALYGGISAAKNSIIFDHFLNSTFETEIYQRLEPAFEEMADTQVRLEEIEIKMDRLNLNIQRYKRHPPVSEFPSLSIEGKISLFMKIVVLINITIGIFLYTLRFPGEYAPYVFTLLFILWWFVITEEYKLWKNPTAWALVVLPVFAVPVMSILLYVVISIGILIGLIGSFLTLYAFGYFTWARYYVEGVLPFRTGDDDSQEEAGDELAGSV